MLSLDIINIIQIFFVVMLILSITCCIPLLIRNLPLKEESCKATVDLFIKYSRCLVSKDYIVFIKYQIWRYYRLSRKFMLKQTLI